jgi:sulfotransferase
MKQFFFLSGVPRSGSTVFSSLISQNPDIYTTPTSPLLDFLEESRVIWPRVSAFQKVNHPGQYPNVERGIISGCYQHVEQPIILEKHRSWVKYTGYIRQVFKQEPKVICTTRRISEVLSSFIRIIEKSPTTTYIDQQLAASNKPINNTTRCRLLWENYISVPWKSFKLGYETNPQSLLLIDYEDIVNNPEETLEKVYGFWGIEPHQQHRFTGINNPQPENDEAYGLQGLHDIRSALIRTSPNPETVLGEELCHYYDSLRLEFWKRAIE